MGRVSEPGIDDPSRVPVEQDPCAGVGDGGEELLLPDFQPDSVEVLSRHCPGFHEQGGEVAGGPSGPQLGHRLQRDRGGLDGHVVDHPRHRAAPDPGQDRFCVAFVAQQIFLQAQQLGVRPAVIVADQGPELARHHAPGAKSSVEPVFVIAATGATARPVGVGALGANRPLLAQVR